MEVSLHCDCIYDYNDDKLKVCPKCSKKITFKDGIYSFTFEPRVKVPEDKVKRFFKSIEWKVEIVSQRYMEHLTLYEIIVGLYFEGKTFDAPFNESAFGGYYPSRYGYDIKGWKRIRFRKKLYLPDTTILFRYIKVKGEPVLELVKEEQPNGDIILKEKWVRHYKTIKEEILLIPVTIPNFTEHLIAIKPVMITIPDEEIINSDILRGKRAAYKLRPGKVHYFNSGYCNGIRAGLDYIPYYSHFDKHSAKDIECYLVYDPLDDWDGLSNVKENYHIK